MGASREHWTWPLQVGANGYIVTADQDSDQEIESCMAVIVSWPIGLRETDENFGVDDQVGLQDGANLDEIRAALATYEQRASENVTQDDEQLIQFLSAVQIGWDTAQAGQT